MLVDYIKNIPLFNHLKDAQLREIASRCKSARYKKGDVVFIPGGIPHWYQNTGDETFEFLCVVPNLPDTTTILEENAC